MAGYGHRPCVIPGAQVGQIPVRLFTWRLQIGGPEVNLEEATEVMSKLWQQSTKSQGEQLTGVLAECRSLIRYSAASLPHPPPRFRTT